MVVKSRIGAPFGDAILAGVSTGIFKDYSIVKQKTQYIDLMEPVQKDHEAYMEYFSIFRKLYTHLKDDFKELAQKIIESNYRKEGILLCGTGIGMAIAANKFPGIYAAVCHDSYSAERVRLSNNTNVMTMGARVIGPELAKRIVREWLELEFKPGSSNSKVEKIEEFEKENLKFHKEEQV